MRGARPFPCGVCTGPAGGHLFAFCSEPRSVSNSSSAAAFGATTPPRPQVLLALLTDLSVDHRCHKWARTLRDAGYEPVILCDQPLHPPGAAWDGFEIRILTRPSHQRRFFPAFFGFLWKLTGEL